MRLIPTEQASRLSMAEAMAAVADAYRRTAEGSIDVPPRIRVPVGPGFLWVMPAYDHASGWSTLKVAFGLRWHLTALVLGWDPTPGADVVVASAAPLGGLRTGATLGLAVRHLAAPEARTVGLVGTGRLAPFLLAGLKASRPDLQDITAYSRDRQRLGAFCQQWALRPADDAAACFTRDVVIVATTSREPVLTDFEVPAGSLLCGMGANWRDEREIGDGIVGQMDRVVCDYLPQARLEAADVIEPIDRGLLAWADVSQLGDVIAGRAPGRQTPAERIFFKSVGIGLEDLAVLQAVVNKIRKESE